MLDLSFILLLYALFYANLPVDSKFFSRPHFFCYENKFILSQPNLPFRT